jgi:hypothetical protein
MIASEHPMARYGRSLIQQESSIWVGLGVREPALRPIRRAVASAYAAVSHSHSDIV